MHPLQTPINAAADAGGSGIALPIHLYSLIGNSLLLEELIFIALRKAKTLWSFGNIVLLYGVLVFISSGSWLIT